MIKAVIFDWGGVIAPNPNGGWMGVLMDALHISFDELEPHWRAAEYEQLSMGQITDHTFWEKFEESFGRPLDIDTAVVWRDGSALTPYPGFMEFISSLKTKDLKVAVLSNTVEPLSARLRSAGLYDIFDVVVLSDEVNDIKPNTTIYQLTLQKLGVQAAECIYIDDLEKNLAPANSLGMTTILVNENSADTISKIESAL